MTFEAKDFEQRLHMLESYSPKDRGHPDDASQDCPTASPPPVLFLLFTGIPSDPAATSANPPAGTIEEWNSPPLVFFLLLTS